MRRNVQWLKKRTQNEYDAFEKFENNKSDTKTVNNETKNENIKNDTETVNNENENEIANNGIKITKRGRVIKTSKRYL